MKKSLSIATAAAVAGYRSKSSGTKYSIIDTSGTLDVFCDGSCVTTFPLDGNTHNLKRIVDSKYFKTIYSNSPGVGDYFGVSCAIGSNFLLVGSQMDDDKGTNAGKVEMFSLDGTYIKTIYSNSPVTKDAFGVSCAIGSNFFLVGSPYDDDKGTDVGKVEMFSLDGTYIKTIYSSSPAVSDAFGSSCAIGSNFFLVGSPYDDDGSFADVGKVEMFSLDGTYIKTIYSSSPATSDAFGRSCAIGSDFFLVGSYLDDDNGTNAGKVEMFSLDGTYIKTIYSNSPVANDNFGISCAIGSDFFLVGSHLDDDKAGDAGKVEMFSLDGTYIKTIYGNSPVSYDYFGISCAIGNDFFLVGSHWDDDKATDAGKVEMFVIVKEDMKDKYKDIVYEKTIYSNNPAANDYFGGRVAIGTDFFLVGSHGDDDQGSDAGKVEMFTLDGTYIKTIYSNNPAANDRFGLSIAIGSDFFLVGSAWDDDKTTDAGKVEMFSLDGTYIKTIYSSNPNAGDNFGQSCAIGSDFFLVGSHSDDDKGADAGKVEMFTLDGTYIKTIYGNSPAVGDCFGQSCAIGTDFFLVGSHGDDDKGTDAGKVEMFALDGTYIKTIYSNSPSAGDNFGGSIAIGNDFFLVGSYRDDDKGTDAGKIEMFTLDGTYIKTIYSNNPAAYDLLGVSCAIGHNFILVGSQGDDDKATDAGKVEMFRLGDITTPLNVSYIDGKFGQCALLNGVSSKIGILTNFNYSNFRSLSMWIKPNVIGGYLFSIGNTNNHAWYRLGLSPTSINSNYMSNGTAVTGLNANSVLNTNTWYHLVITTSGVNNVSTGFEVYLNGVKLSGSFITGSGQTADGYYEIGNYSGSSYNSYFNGSIDQVRIFNKALSLAEVSTLYNEKKVQDSTICDPYWSKTSLLLSGDGTNGSQSFTDLTGKNAIQTVGNAQISTSNKKFGTGSMYFDGNGDYLTTPSSSNFNFGFSDFTVEANIYITNLTTWQSICGQQSWSGNTGWGLWLNGSSLYIFFNGTASVVNTGFNLSTNTWYNICLVKNGNSTNNIKVFVNGNIVYIGTYTSGLSDSTAPFTCGGIDGLTGWNGNFYFNGYIDDLRITKGIARYTSNFTVQTKALPVQGI